MNETANTDREGTMPEGLTELQHDGTRTLYRQQHDGAGRTMVELYWHDSATMRRESAVTITGPEAHGDHTRNAEVNWSAHGSVEVAEAREYAALLALACDVADELTTTFTREQAAATTPEPVTARLAEMLGTGDAEDRAAETTGNTAARPTPRADEVLTGTGRGPTGRLRNFKAMSDAKFRSAMYDVLAEGDDPEAIDAARAEATRRGWVG